jgi:hypothetical protein
LSVISQLPDLSKNNVSAKLTLKNVHENIPLLAFPSSL